MYVFGRFAFKILGQDTFTLTEGLFLYLEVLFFITIFIHRNYFIFTIFIIITIIIVKYYILLLLKQSSSFSLVTSYVLPLY